jgi:hypothetical protein
MSQENLVSLKFTPQEVTDLNDALATVISIIEPKAINLTPAERQLYGKVRYEFEVWIDKTRGHMLANPTLVPNYIDTVEYESDYAARSVIKPIEPTLKKIYEIFDDIFVLLGHDLYVNSLAFYNAVKIAAKQNVPGSTSIYQDLKQQFPGGRKKKEDPKTPPNPETPATPVTP